MGAGVSAETPANTVLPLLELAASGAGVGDAMHLGAELAASGYFEAGLVGQWQMIHDLLWQRLEGQQESAKSILHLATYPEAKIRFYTPGLWARWGADKPQAALDAILPLAADVDFRVLESSQAFGLRPFAQQLGPGILDLLAPWFKHPDPRVRRAAVTAVRPRGFWVKNLEWAVEHPGYLVPILESFRDEEDRFPANAVANCCNDISRRQPLLALSLLGRWLQGELGSQTEHMARKGLRSLSKAGDPRVLELFGFGKLELQVTATLRQGQTVAPNTNLCFELQVQNLGASCQAELVYELESTGRIAGRPRRKRYQGGRFDLESGQQTEILVRERIFDRKAALLIDGAAGANFLFNGDIAARVDFEIQREEQQSDA
jgi:3-methyladenine DNA glycosylase AlkC